jgi:predicted porin
MKRVFSFFGFLLKLIIFGFSYAFSKKFRALVNYKMAQYRRGSTEPVTSGEEVSAVLFNAEGKTVIR